MKSARVLIVDDSATVLQWAQEELSQFGIEVIPHQGPFGLLGMVRSNAPDIILLDVNMPALAGSTVCKLFRKNAMPEVLVCLYSSLSENELQEIANECGADAILQKTKDAAALASNIHRLLDQHKKN